MLIESQNLLFFGRSQFLMSIKKPYMEAEAQSLGPKS